MISVNEHYNVSILAQGTPSDFTEANLKAELKKIFHIFKEISLIDEELYQSEFEFDDDIERYIDNYLSKKTNNILDIYDFDKHVLILDRIIDYTDLDQHLNDYINDYGFECLKCLKLLNINFFTSGSEMKRLMNIIKGFVNLQELYISNKNLKDEVLSIIIITLPEFEHLYRFEFCIDDVVFSNIISSIKKYADLFKELMYLKCVDLRNTGNKEILCYVIEKLQFLGNLKELVLDYSILEILDNDVINKLIQNLPLLKILTKLVLVTHHASIIELIKDENNKILKDVRITAPMTSDFYKSFYYAMLGEKYSYLEYLELKNTLKITDTSIVEHLGYLLEHRKVEYDFYSK